MTVRYAHHCPEKISQRVRMEQHQVMVSNVENHREEKKLKNKADDSIRKSLSRRDGSGDGDEAAPGDGEEIGESSRKDTEEVLTAATGVRSI